MEKKFKGIVYRATNSVNGKVYIGQTVRTLKQRMMSHKQDAFNKHSSLYFHRALRKYGFYSFIWEVIEECPNESLLFEREIYWIAVYNSTNDEKGYNMSEGGFNPRLKGKRNGMYHRTHTDEVKKRISVAHKNLYTCEKSYRWISIDSESLRKDYVEGNLTLEEMNIKYNCSGSTLIRRIKDLNIENLDSISRKRKGVSGRNRKIVLDDETLNSIFLDIKNGYTNKQISIKYKHNTRLLFNLLKNKDYDLFIKLNKIRVHDSYLKRRRQK
jgi:group I intron endonuclease